MSMFDKLGHLYHYFDFAKIFRGSGFDCDWKSGLRKNREKKTKKNKDNHHI